MLDAAKSFAVVASVAAASFAAAMVVKRRCRERRSIMLAVGAEGSGERGEEQSGQMVGVRGRQ